MPQNKSVRVPKGTDLLSAATRCGIVLNASCGGEGLCGKCRVVVEKGKVDAGPSHLISDHDRRRGVVLACDAAIESDLDVRVPVESLEVHEKRRHETEEFTKGVAVKREGVFPFIPLARKVYLELPAPTADDNESDLERIQRTLKRVAFAGEPVEVKLSSLKHLSEMLRESDFKATVSVGHKDGAIEILSIEGGDTTAECYGLAFDIGTTTVVGQLVDLNTGNVLGTRIAFNKQAAHGSDIITRIVFASEPEGRATLNGAVLSNINEIIEDLAEYHSVNLGSLYATVCAGNMTMIHLLLNIDPAPIRKVPYVPTANAFPTIWASEARIETNPKALVSFVPGVGAYVGGDIVSGLLACGLAERDELSLLIDIGTNGEIVLGNRDWMLGAAASAGPAFEGSGLACGMKAVSGAIQKVAIGDDLSVEYETIANARPKGICGSGYIDLLCQMLKRGIISKDGRINRDLKTKRVRRSGAVYEFVVAAKSETEGGKDVVIQDDDIENLKRAKGAIYSAVIALLNKVGKGLADVAKIYIAGGFGNYLNIENAVFIGLLPDANREAYEFIGNASLAGARMSLLSHAAFVETQALSKRVTYIDLGTEPDYMDEYVAALFFPHTDIRRFPSVRL